MNSRLIVAAVFASVCSTAVYGAEETVNGQTATLKNAPCAWFKKVHNDTWESDHALKIDDSKNAIKKLAFQKGIFKMDDGQDAYDFLEHRCGSAKR